MEPKGTSQEWAGSEETPPLVGGQVVEPEGNSRSGRGTVEATPPTQAGFETGPLWSGVVPGETRLTAPPLGVTCSSMVIRDLTLRSAASFGSFHLIRLLYDEYMYYLIEHRVAQAKGETPIAVMGEVRGGAGAGGGRCRGRGLTCSLVPVPAVRQPGHRAEPPGH